MSNEEYRKVIRKYRSGLSDSICEVDIANWYHITKNMMNDTVIVIEREKNTK